jgi:putative endonuclease
MLVWFEQFGDIELAIRREKRTKEWKRLWKLRVIEEMNPDWNDLFESLL